MIINTSLLTEKLEYIEEAHIVLADGGVEVCEGFCAEGMDLKKHLAVPSFFNAHTHLGDSFAIDACAGLKVKAAVGKGGEKWRLYEGSTREERIDAMRASMEYMLSGGVTGFCDFREFGSQGIEELKEASENIPIKKIILGRDDPKDCDGLGLNLYQIDQIRKGCFLALHAGELFGEVGEAIGYDPDIIVHATTASDEELESIADRKISVVVCPRANASLKAGFPPIEKMLDLGINVCLGTDNVMLNSPDMFRELDYVLKNTGLDAKEILELACLNAKKAFGFESDDFFFLDKESYNLKYSRNIYASIASRCDPCDVKKVICDGVLL